MIKLLCVWGRGPSSTDTDTEKETERNGGQLEEAGTGRHASSPTAQSPHKAPNLAAANATVTADEDPRGDNAGEGPISEEQGVGEALLEREQSARGKTTGGPATHSGAEGGGDMPTVSAASPLRPTTAAVAPMRKSVELFTSTEFVAPGNAAVTAGAVGAGDSPLSLDAVYSACARPPRPPPNPPPHLRAAAAEVDTHFLRKDGGNQPAVMNSIAGLFAAGAPMEADDTRDRAFEEALERVRASRREIADKAARGFSDMRAYYEAELEAARISSGGEGGGGEPSAAGQQPRRLIEAVAAAAAAADAEDVEGEAARGARGRFSWEANLAAAAHLPGNGGGDIGAAVPFHGSSDVRESVWPDAWKGSYSPPREMVAQPPYPLPRSWAFPPEDRASDNPPEAAAYPHEAAAAAAALAAAVAAQQRYDSGEEPSRQRRVHHASQSWEVERDGAPPRWSQDQRQPVAWRDRGAKEQEYKPEPEQEPEHQHQQWGHASRHLSPSSLGALADVVDKDQTLGSMQERVGPTAHVPMRPATAPGPSPSSGPGPGSDNPGIPFDIERGTLQQQVKKLRAALVACERREADGERAAAAAEQLAEGTALRLKDAAARLQARDAEIRELGHQSVVLREGVAASAAEAQECLRKLSAANSAATRMTSEVADQRHRREALERTAGELTAAVEAVKRDSIDLQSKLARAQDDNGRLREKLAAAEEREKDAARTTGRLTKEGDVARREGQMLRMHNQKGASENTGLASALQVAKQEAAELRQRCKYLEKMALAAATGQVPPSQRFQNSPGLVKRDQRETATMHQSPERKPPQHQQQPRQPLKQQPLTQPHSQQDDIENTSPRSRKQWQMPAAGRPTVPSQAWGAHPAPGEDEHDDPDPNLHPDRSVIFRSVIQTPGTDHSQDDHVGMDMIPTAGSSGREHFISEAARGHSQDDQVGRGMIPMAGAARPEHFVSEAIQGHSQDDHVGCGMVPTAGSSQREAFASAYGMDHAGKDTASHLGAGMVPMSALDSRAADAAREGAARRAAAAEAGENEARRPLSARTHSQHQQQRVNNGGVSGAGTGAGTEAAAPSGAQTARRRPSTASTPSPMATTLLHHSGGATETAADRYSASDALRRGRDGSGWYGGVLEGGAPPLPPPPLAERSRSSDPPPWVLPAEAHAGGRLGPGATAAVHARPANDEAPFATAESFASWSAHVAAVEARLMQVRSTQTLTHPAHQVTRLHRSTWLASPPLVYDPRSFTGDSLVWII